MWAGAGRRALKSLFAATVLRFHRSRRRDGFRQPVLKDPSAGEIALRLVEVEFGAVQGSVPFGTGVRGTDWSRVECADAADKAASGPAVSRSLPDTSLSGTVKLTVLCDSSRCVCLSDEGQIEVMVMGRVRPVRHAGCLAGAISRRPDEILRNVVGPLSALYTAALLLGQEHGSDNGRGVPTG
jgi:hypothetical protein